MSQGISTFLRDELSTAIDEADIPSLTLERWAKNLLHHFMICD